jgi:hypothetical protein
MKNFVRLNKNEMKMVMGGVEIEEVGDGGGKGYKCCYTNPSGCSVCDTSASPSTHTCPNNGHSNGTLTAC